MGGDAGLNRPNAARPATLSLTLLHPDSPDHRGHWAGKNLEIREVVERSWAAKTPRRDTGSDARVPTGSTATGRFQSTQRLLRGDDGLKDMRDRPDEARQDRSEDASNDFDRDAGTLDGGISCRPQRLRRLPRSRRSPSWRRAGAESCLP
jgi:hypothetical protein